MRRNPEKKRVYLPTKDNNKHTPTQECVSTLCREHSHCHCQAEPLKWFQRSVGVKLRHIHSGCDGAHTAPLLASFSPSSIRALATPWTYFLHLSLSSVIPIDFSAESTVTVVRYDTMRYDTIRDAILTCARKPT